MKKIIIQITSGKGPAECCRVVACVQNLMMKQAKQQGFQMKVLENKAGELNETLSTSRLNFLLNIIFFAAFWLRNVV